MANKTPKPDAAGNALLELERRMMAGDPEITPAIAEKIKAKIGAYRSQGLLPKAGVSANEEQATNIRQAVNMASKVDRALKAVSGTTAGIGGSIIGNIPGTEGRDLRGDIETLKANLTFDELKRLKEASPTGASGLGSLTEKEGSLLAAAVANLDPNQSPERLRENLQEVSRHYAAWVGSLGYDDEQIREANNGVNPFATGGGDEPPPSVGGAQPPLARTELEMASGGRQADLSPETEALRGEISQLIANGNTADEIRGFARAAGLDANAIEGLDEAVAWRKRNPNYQGGYTVNITQPLSPTRQAISDLAASPVGAYAINAADTALLGGLDELAPGDTAINNIGKRIVSDQNPVASALGAFSTGVPMALGGEALLAARGLTYAAPIADTAFGVLTGIGQQNENRAKGAVLGGAFGLGGSVLGRGAANVIGAGRSVLDAGRRVAGADPNIGVNLVSRKLAEDGLTPADAAGLLSNASENGVPLTLADLGENLRALGGSVSRQAGSARSIAKGATIDRQLGQGDRIKDAINRDLGPTTDILQTSADMMRGASAKAAPLYEAAYANPAVSTPELDALLATPAGRQAIARARTIAANERRDPSAMGFALDDNGDVVLNQVDIDAHGRLATARSEVDAARAELEGLRARAGGGGAAGVPSAEKRLADAEAAFAQAEQSLASNPTPDVAATVRGYTPQTLDYVKRGLDDVIESHRDPVTGKLRLDEGLRAINQVKVDLLRELDKTIPGYSEARAAYGGDASLVSAMRDGQKALNKSASEIRQRVQNMNQAEREQYALGLRSAIADNLDRGGDSANKVNTLIGSPKKREALQEVFGAGTDLDRLMSTLSAERDAFQTYAAVNSGSPTAPRLLEDAQNADSELLTGLGQDFAALGRGKTALLGRVAERASGALRYGIGEAGKRAREDAASILFTPDLGDFQNALSGIAARQENRAALGNALKDSFGRVGALTGSGIYNDQINVTPSNPKTLAEYLNQRQQRAW